MIGLTRNLITLSEGGLLAARPSHITGLNFLDLIIDHDVISEGKGSGCQLRAPYRGGPSSITGQVMWELR